MSKTVIFFIHLLHYHLSSVPLLNHNHCLPFSYKSRSYLIATNRCLQFAHNFSCTKEHSPGNFSSKARLHPDNSSKLANELLCSVHAARRLQSNDSTAGHVIRKAGFLHESKSTVIPLNLLRCYLPSLVLLHHLTNALPCFETTEVGLYDNGAFTHCLVTLTLPFAKRISSVSRL